MNFISRDIEDYAARHSVPESALFKALTRETRKRTAWPQMSVGHLEGQVLAALIKISGARRVLEVGTFTGYSTLAMAEALPDGGRITTLDIDPINTKIARDFWKKSPAGKKITLVIGPALESLRELKGPFDLAFIDADKRNYVHYWNEIVPKIRSGGLIIVDNVLWSGAVLKPAKKQDDDTKAIAAFNRSIADDKRVSCVMLTVRDGMTLAVKN